MVTSVAVAAVNTSLPWNVCILAVCNQSLSRQLAQMTVTTLQIFLSLLWVQQKPVYSLQSELINHQTHAPGAMAIKIAVLWHYSCYGGVTSSTIWIY